MLLKLRIPIIMSNSEHFNERQIILIVTSWQLQLRRQVMNRMRGASCFSLIRSSNKSLCTAMKLCTTYHTLTILYPIAEFCEYIITVYVSNISISIILKLFQ